MDWQHWMVCGKDGLDVYTPLEPLPDGGVNIVYGLALVVPFDELQKLWIVKTVVRVDDEYECTNPRVEYDPDNLLAVCVPGKAE